MFIRRIIILISLFSLLVGLTAGITRAGEFNLLFYINQYHFLIMIGSFLGTLITLERVVTIENKVFHYLPLLNGSSLIFFLLNEPEIANLMLVLGGLILTLIFLYFLFSHNDLVHWLFLLSGIAYTLGMLVFYLDKDLFLSVRLLEMFLLITIIAERLELSKFIGISNFKKYILLLFLILSGFFLKINEIAYGVSIILIALWLMQNDIARINIKKSEPFRFRGIALMFGYFWLLINGLTIVFPKYSTYDLQIHSFFLGFVMNMIFAHITIILPAVLKVKIKENYFLNYTVLITFQIVLILRFLSTILFGSSFPHLALVNAIVLLLFFIVNLFSTLSEKIHKSLQGPNV
jgi:hypothetical protein